jgi:sugar porter (SP) family MFS transporter
LGPTRTSWDTPEIKRETQPSLTSPRSLLDHLICRVPTDEGYALEVDVYDSVDFIARPRSRFTICYLATTPIVTLIRPSSYSGLRMIFYDSHPTGIVNLGERTVVFVTLLSCLGFSLVGYGNGLMGGFINEDGFLRRFGYPDDGVISFVTAIYGIGAFSGAIFTAILGDYLGRRPCIALGSIIMMVGAIFQGTAVSIPQLIVGRIVAGFGLGVINSSVPVLQAELSPQHSRGTHVAIYCTTLNLGILVVYWINFWAMDLDSDLSWQLPTFLQIVILVPLFILTTIVPESPRWLLAHDRDDAGKLVLANMTHRDPNDRLIINQAEILKETILLDLADKRSFFRDIYKSDEMQSCRRLWTSFGIQIFQQLGGINVLIFYTTSLFEKSIGFSPRSAALMSGLLQTWLVVASIIPWFLIDRLGRIPLIMGGIFVQFASMAMQSFFVYQIDNQTNLKSSSAIGAAIMLFVFEGAFTIGMQATVWVYCSEILPLRLRNKGTALSTSGNWLANFFVLHLAPILLQSIGYGTYLLFAVLNALFLPLVMWYFKETKGLSLEEIDGLFILGL